MFNFGKSTLTCPIGIHLVGCTFSTQVAKINGTHFIVHDENDVFNVAIFHEDAPNVRFRCAFA